MKIGMRNIKTALAVFFSLIIIKLLKLDSPFYAAIAAVIAMQSSVKDSFNAGKNRIIGTFVGAFVGFLFALIQPGNPFLSALGIIIVIYICSRFEWNQSVSIAGIVFLAIMINLKDKGPLAYSINRIIDTFIGISVAVIVNYFIVPPNNLNLIQGELKAISDKTDSIIKDKFCFGKGIDLDSLNGEIEKLKTHVDNYLNEVRMKDDEAFEVDEIRMKINLYKRIYEHLIVIDHLGDDLTLSRENIDALIKLNNCWIDDKPLLNTEDEVVYNYHVKKLVECCNLLKI